MGQPARYSDCFSQPLYSGPAATHLYNYGVFARAVTKIHNGGHRCNLDLDFRTVLYQYEAGTPYDGLSRCLALGRFGGFLRNADHYRSFGGKAL